MIVDAHYHLDERMESVDRLICEMDRCGIDRAALIPTMCDVLHAASSVTSMLLAIGRWALMGRVPAMGRALYRSTVTRSGQISLLGQKLDVYPEPDHEPLARAMAQYPDRLLGWVFVNPLARDPIAVVERYLAEPGWIGVKSHPFWHCYAIRELDDTAAYCVDKNLPLLVHLGGDGERGDFRWLPDRHPKLRIVYAHAGVPFFRELWDDVKRRDNVFVDLSSPYLDEPLRRRVVRTLGPSKCLYGSDGPYGYPGRDGMYDHSVIVEEIQRLPITAAEMDQVLGANFETLVRG